MTAKEWIENEIGNAHDNPNIDNDVIAELMNNYTLSIVEKVVTKLNNENPYGDPLNRESYTPYRQGLADGIDSVLDEIKNEIGE